jgi:hypothetical protein
MRIRAALRGMVGHGTERICGCEPGPAKVATLMVLAGKPHFPQVAKASANARSPGVPFSIARMARRPLL